MCTPLDRPICPIRRSQWSSWPRTTIVNTISVPRRGSWLWWFMVRRMEDHDRCLSFPSFIFSLSLRSWSSPVHRQRFVFDDGPRGSLVCRRLYSGWSYVWVCLIVIYVYVCMCVCVLIMCSLAKQ